MRKINLIFKDTHIIKKEFELSITDHINVFKILGGRFKEVCQILEALLTSINNGGKIMLCGNGGSAADCQHIAAELTGRFMLDRSPLPALALTTDTSAITAIANDYDYDDIFARQVAALGSSCDSLIAISTSGNSKNVQKAVEIAKKLNITTIGLLGKDGGSLLPLLDHSIVVESTSTARIQEAHIFIGHVFCKWIEECLIASQQEEETLQ